MNSRNAILKTLDLYPTVYKVWSNDADPARPAGIRWLVYGTPITDMLNVVDFGTDGRVTHASGPTLGQLDKGTPDKSTKVRTDIAQVASTALASRPTRQGLDLARAVDAILAAFPTAVTAHFQASDQDYYGFNLVDVELPGGQLASEMHADQVQTLVDQVWSMVGDIDWDGVMGEDDGGAAVIGLIPTAEEAA